VSYGKARAEGGDVGRSSGWSPPQTFFLLYQVLRHNHIQFVIWRSGEILVERFAGFVVTKCDRCDRTAEGFE
jgi:hypothetical protein